MEIRPTNLDYSILEPDIWADLAADQTPMTLNVARRQSELRKNDKPLDLTAMYRFSSRGVRPAGGGDGDFVVLETCQIGGSRCTTKGSILRFVMRCSGADPATKTTPADADRAHRDAEQRLAAAGL